MSNANTVNLQEISPKHMIEEGVVNDGGIHEIRL